MVRIFIFLNIGFPYSLLPPLPLYVTSPFISFFQSKLLQADGLGYFRAQEILGDTLNSNNRAKARVPAVYDTHVFVSYRCAQIDRLFWRA